MELTWKSVKGIPEGSAMARWNALFADFGRRTNCSFTIIEDDIQVKGIQAGGFVDIVVKDLKTHFDDQVDSSKEKEMIENMLHLAIHTDLEDVKGSKALRCVCCLYHRDATLDLSILTLKIHRLSYVTYAFGVVLVLPKDIAKFVTGLREQADDESVRYRCARRAVYGRKPQ